MQAVSYSEARENLKAMIDKVVADRAPIAITRQRGEGAVLISESEWASIEETLYREFDEETGIKPAARYPGYAMFRFPNACSATFSALLETRYCGRLKRCYEVKGGLFTWVSEAALRQALTCEDDSPKRPIAPAWIASRRVMGCRGCLASTRGTGNALQGQATFTAEQQSSAPYAGNASV